MTLSDSRQSRRPIATLRPLPSLMMGLPRLPEPPFRRAVPTTPADRAGARVDCFPAHAAFPKWPKGRHPHCHFRGLLRLHSRYGPPDRSVAQGDLCHEAPAPPVTPPAARQLPDQSTTLWWNFPPPMICAFGAHGQHETSNRASRCARGGCVKVYVDPDFRNRGPSANDFATSRAQSMNCSATGFSVRFFAVTITMGHGGVGKSIGSS